MSDIKQNIVFPGSGLNYDDDERWMPLGDSKLRRNILVGDDESNGLITNMLGCVRSVDIADHELYLSNVYKVIGSYYNRLTRKVYYFIFSQPYEIASTGGSTSTTTTTTTESGDESLVIDYTAGDFQYDNMLLEYIEDTQELNVIFRDPKNYFGLHIDYPMRDLVMIGDWLYFNPRVSEPKMIDVVRAYNYTNYDAYDATLTYAYGEYVTFYGGLFRANTSVAVGETPSTTEAKWDRIGDAYQDESNLTGFDSEFRYAFNVIKQAPISRPTLRYGTDTEVHSNSVRQKLFRFSHRFRYFDDSFSVFSGYSDVSLPEQDEAYNGEILNDTTINNYINVTIQLHSPALIKEIEIVAQEIGQSWKRIRTVKRQERSLLTESTYVEAFYNNEAYDAVDDSLVAKIYDSVPKQAKAQEIINRNILCYGGVTEGFDNVPKEDIDVILTPELESFEEGYSHAAFKRDSIGSGDITYGTNPDATWDIGAVWTAAGLVGNDMVSVLLNGGFNYATLSAADVLTAASLTSKVCTLMTGWYPSLSFSISGTTVLCSKIVQGDTVVFDAAVFYTPVGTLTSLTKKRGFKTGAFHPFCIFYYDENLRRWDAQTSKDSQNSIGYTYDGTTVYVPMFNEISPLPDSTNYRWTIDWEVNHLPPDGAKYWRWGYAGNTLCTKFVQYIVSSIADGTDEEENMTVIDITPLQTLKFTDGVDTGVQWNQFPSSKIEPYTFQKGDRIRFITLDGDPGTPGTNLGTLVNGVYDMEIIKQGDVSAETYTKFHDYDPTVAYILGQEVRYNRGLYRANASVAVGETPGNTPGKWDIVPDPYNSIYVQKFDWASMGVSTGECCLVEIYTPLKKETKEVYYEFGGLLRIIEDSSGVRVHEGTTSNQSSVLGTPATGTFNSGDVYHIKRTPSKPLDLADPDVGVFHESMWWSDFYDSSDWDKGKAGVETNFGERMLNIIRFSNPYLQDTLINGLPTFEALNYKELNDVFGNIVAIYEVGDTLKCYQERKASSIFIGKTEYTDAEGRTTVAVSSSVLGAVRYSPTNFSTVFPESIQRNNRYIYGFDIYNGVMWRDSANGIFPISGRFVDVGGDVDYKMATWFKEKSKGLLTSGIGHCDVMSVWDEEFKNLHVTFVDYNNEDNNETIVFHEPSNRWICFEDLHQTPPSYNIMVECSNYTILKGFEGGLGYSFDEDTRFACFNIVTPGNKAIDMDVISLGMTAYAPSATSDGVPAPEQLGMTMTAYTPTVLIQWLYGSVSSLWFAYDADSALEYSALQMSMSDDLEPFTIDITAVPWVEYAVYDASNTSEVSNPALWGNGCYIRVYPSAENTGVERGGNLIIRGGSYTPFEVAVTQQAAPATVTVRAGDNTELTVSSTGGNVIGGLNIEFTPHYVPGGDPTFDVCWLIKVNDVEVYSSYQTGIACTQDVHENMQSIDYGSATWNDGDMIDVYLYYEEAPLLS
jgi:hypothetical protein